MTPANIIHASKAAIDVLPLACQQAEGRWHWWQINRLVAELVSGLRAIEVNDDILPGLRKEAREDADSLRDIMKTSCLKIEEFDRKPPVVNLSDSPQIENRTKVVIPEEVLNALKKASPKLNYSRLNCVFSCYCLSEGHWFGVAGDGKNAAYEWFVFRNGKLETSDCGCGDTLVSLRDVLNKEVK